MKRPVVVLGAHNKTGQIITVGLFEDAETAQREILCRESEPAMFSVWMPEMNGFAQVKPPADVYVRW